MKEITIKEGQMCGYCKHFEQGATCSFCSHPQQIDSGLKNYAYYNFGTTCNLFEEGTANEKYNISYA